MAAEGAGHARMLVGSASADAFCMIERPASAEADPTRVPVAPERASADTRCHCAVPPVPYARPRCLPGSRAVEATESSCGRADGPRACSLRYWRGLCCVYWRKTRIIRTALPNPDSHAIARIFRLLLASSRLA